MTQNQYTINVPTEVYSKLDAIAKERGVSIEQLFKEAIRMELAEQEAQEREEETDD